MQNNRSLPYKNRLRCPYQQKIANMVILYFLELKKNIRFSKISWYVTTSEQAFVLNTTANNLRQGKKSIKRYLNLCGNKFDLRFNMLLCLLIIKLIRLSKYFFLIQQQTHIAGVYIKTVLTSGYSMFTAAVSPAT